MMSRRTRSYFTQRPDMVVQQVRTLDMCTFYRQMWSGSLGLAWYTFVFREDVTVREQLQNYTPRGEGLIRMPRRNYWCWVRPRPPTSLIARLAVINNTLGYGIMFPPDHRDIALFSATAGKVTWDSLILDTEARCVTRVMRYHIFDCGMPR